MGKSFNHEGAALSDIVARPEITGGNEQQLAAVPEVAQKAKAGIKPVEIDPADDDRNGRLMVSAFSSVMKTLKGEELDKDHAGAAAEFGAYISYVMREFAVPRGVYAAFLGIILGAPMAVIAFKALKPKTEAKNGQ